MNIRNDYSGKRFGKYYLIQKLGNGGFGSVYKVFDNILGVEKALKILEVSNPEEAYKLFSEAAIPYKCQHNHVIKINSGEIIKYNGEKQDGKEYTGWVLTRYIVIQPMTITLLSSNLPAYCAPDRSSKQVGSLARQTELTVLGTWGDFYIVSLRNASAFIAMDADLITSDELYLSLYTASGVARTLRNTQMHSGPGDDWKTVATVPAGTEIHCGTLRDDWLLVLYNGIPGFVPFEDVQIVRTDDGNG